MTLRESFENKLVDSKTNHKFLLGSANVETTSIYDEYLAFELSNSKNGHRVIYLYERILADCFLIPKYWLSYLNYISKTLPKSINIKFDISKRAVRNCCWESLLWIEYVFAAGQKNVDCTEVVLFTYYYYILY